ELAVSAAQQNEALLRLERRKTALEDQLEQFRQRDGPRERAMDADERLQPRGLSLRLGKIGILGLDRGLERVVGRLMRRDDLETTRADGNAIAGLEHGGGLQPFAVDARAVGRAEVLDPPAALARE